MKKLLAAGEAQDRRFRSVCRNRERGPLHAPEFTMVEWYRAGATYEAVMADCATLLAPASRAADRRRSPGATRTADPFAEPERLTVPRPS